MKTLNSFMLLAGIVFITAHATAQAPAATTNAQNKNGSDANAMAQQLTESVKRTVTGITPDEESKILAAEQDYSKGIIDVRNTNPGAGSQSDKMASYNKVMALAQTRDTQLKSILTADQYTQYQKTAAPMPTTMPAQQQPGK